MKEALGTVHCVILWILSSLAGLPSLLLSESDYVYFIYSLKSV